MTSLFKRPLSPLAVVLSLSAAFFVIFLMITGALFMSKSSDTGPAASMSKGFFGPGKVAVVELNGVIMDSKKVLKKLERYEEMDEIKAVVLRLNSPGGSVAPSQEIYDAVKRYKKPIVSSMASVAASGAYYIACGTKKVFANPGTITGSIGVIMEFANLEKLYEWAKVRRFSIKTGKFKDAGAEYREMQPEERALLQGMVDDVLLQFKQAVSEGRKIPLEQVDLVADGRIFSGSQAKQAKLVDELGGIQDAINEAAKMAGIKGKPKVYYPERQTKGRLLELLLDDSKDEDAESSASNGLLGLVRTFVSGASASAPSLTESITGLTPGVYWIWSGAR